MHEWLHFANFLDIHDKLLVFMIRAVMYYSKIYWQKYVQFFELVCSFRKIDRN